MVLKILIFKFIFYTFLLSNNILNAKTIIGVPQVIDGDTIRINSNKIRLHGMDAPETKQNYMVKKNNK